MRFVTADGLEFTDLALFDLAASYSLFSRLELGASVVLLPKQPADSDEKRWQSATGIVRSPLNANVALQLSMGGGHLLGHTGKWLQEAMTLEWKKPIDRDFLAFDVQASISGLGIDAPTTDDSAFLTEVALQTTALFREPHGHWGGWLGVGYAYPVQSSGVDPTTGLAIDPQPRVSFHAGTVLSVVRAWDIYADFAVIDRGEMTDPATRLPIVDGGFDQKQIMFGVTRHFDRSGDAAGASDSSPMILGSL
jgi:hypothetical protein